MLIEIEGHVLFAIKDEIGDKLHYILECKHFEKKSRITCIDAYCRNRHSAVKFGELMK